MTLNDENSKLVEKQGRKAKGLRSMTMTAGCRIWRLTEKRSS